MRAVWRVVEAAGLALIGYHLVTLTLETTREDRRVRRIYTPGGNE